jgi:hypothetical protein
MYVCIYIYIYIYIYRERERERERLSSKAVTLHAVKAIGGDRSYDSYYFLTSALDGGKWSASRRRCALPPGKEPPVPIVPECGLAPELV